MMQELEDAIRAIVRDEIRNALSSTFDMASKVPRERTANMRGHVQNLIVAALTNGPLSTSQITNALWRANTSSDRGTLSASIRNAVFTMHKQKKLIRHTEGRGEWTYSLAQAIGGAAESGSASSQTEPTQSAVAVPGDMPKP